MPPTRTAQFTRGPVALRSEASSDRDPFDDVSGDLAVAAVVETGGSGIGVAGEVLHVFQWDSLAEEVGDRGDSERVRRKPLREARRPHPSLDHSPDVACGHRSIGDPLRSPHHRAEEGTVGADLGLNRYRLKVVGKESLQVVADGDFA